MRCEVILIPYLPVKTVKFFKCIDFYIDYMLT